MPSRRPPHPATPPPRESLPHPITFFFTSRDRDRVLAALRKHHHARAHALLIALKIKKPNP